MPLTDYEELRHLCSPPETAINSEVKSEDMYVSTRGMVPPRQKNTNSGRKWFGKLDGKSFAVSLEKIVMVDRACTCKSNEFPPALSADLIIYECIEKPNAPTVFHGSSAHRRSCNRMKHSVICKVLKPYEFVPVSDR